MISIKHQELRELTRDFESPEKATLLRLIDSAPAVLSVPDTVPAPNLLSIYRVRRDRWKETGLPPSVGLPEFVKALEAQGTATLTIAAYDAPRQHVVLLFSERLDRLLAFIAISQKEPGEER